MRLTQEQVRERFEREVGANPLLPTGALLCTRKNAVEFALRLARDLQAPPTGEEVTIARENETRQNPTMSESRQEKSEKKRGRGRAALPPGKRRSVWIGTHVTEAEKAGRQAVACAEMPGRPFADWVAVRLGLDRKVKD